MEKESSPASRRWPSAQAAAACQRAHAAVGTDLADAVTVCDDDVAVAIPPNATVTRMTRTSSYDGDLREL